MTYYLLKLRAARRGRLTFIVTTLTLVGGVSACATHAAPVLAILFAVLAVFSAAAALSFHAACRKWHDRLDAHYRVNEDALLSTRFER